MKIELRDIANNGRKANFANAKKNKNDEFYTRLSDIEGEMKHYKNKFKGKIVYCNCDDPRDSKFFYYFSYNFEKLGLKKLITSCYKSNFESAVHLEYNGDKNGNRVPDAEEIGTNHFVGNGDFRSDESIALLKQADIVVTNPPFSLFREYIAQLIEYDKKFIILGNMGSIIYKDIFPLIKNNKIWYGVNAGVKKFDTVNGTVSMGNTRWYTNLDHKKRHEDVLLYKTYNPVDYPKFDNSDAINVLKTKEVPMDYNGVMGVPITFMDKFNPKQFKIVSFRKGDDGKDLRINGKDVYTRLLIKRKIAS